MFLGFDDGGRRILNPKTNKPIAHIADVTCFEDMRAVCNTKGLLTTGMSLVIDTVTTFEPYCERYTFANVPKTSRDGDTYVTNLKAYGFGEGYSHLRDTFRLFLSDLEILMRQGVNIILLAQEGHHKMKSTSEGSDYSKTGPRLYHDQRCSLVEEVVEWCDTVAWLSYNDLAVVLDRPTDQLGKALGEEDRIIHVSGKPAFWAKSRTLDIDLITFAHKADDSFWRYLFNKETA